ncbi:MAG: phosphoribosylamine--glycine ligase N-terminal domain-containing protein, partial [Bacteroidota bacterium]
MSQQKRILLLGSGGREHAIAWKLSGSNRCEKLFIAPGN